MKGWLARLFVTPLPKSYPQPSDLVFPDAETDGRFVSLEGGFNFRDIGGYQTKDGRFVRRNRVFRSGTLHHLTPNDHQTLLDLGLKFSCDVRSASEAERHPDNLPAAIAYKSLNMTGGQDRISRLRGLRTILFARHRLEDLMLYGYTQVILEDNSAVLANGLRTIANADNLPLVIHCSAGKDRTGVLVALLLSLLGVPDETILADYSLSNLSYDHVADMVRPDVERLLSMGIPLDELRPVMVAPPPRLTTALNGLRKKYGSIDDYLIKRLGLEEETLENIRRNLLTG